VEYYKPERGTALECNVMDKCTLIVWTVWDSAILLYLIHFTLWENEVIHQNQRGGLWHAS